jgi:heat shock protein HtpX
MKTTVLFLGTNIAILAMLTFAMKVLGIEPYMASQGVNINLTGLLVFAAVFGMAGSLISLLMSKSMAKRMMGLRLIDGSEGSAERWLVATVRSQAERSGIEMPEVAVFDSPQPNAFATGANRNAALVAVSTGLLNAMSREEVEAVLGHEVAHVANGDMLRLALIQGVVNTFVLFLSRIVGHLVDRVVLKNERGHGPGFWITTIVAEIVLGLLATIIVMWFSRQREFRADAGGAALVSREAMVGALRRLKAASEGNQLPDQLAAFGISGLMAGGIKKLFMSHPPLDERIAALQAGPVEPAAGTVSQRQSVVRRR